MLKPLLGTLAIAVAASACLPAAVSRAVPLTADPRVEAARAPLGKAASQVGAPDVLPGNRAFLDRNCVVCHNQQLRTAGLSLDTIDLHTVADNAAIWERVIRKLRSGAMPPPARPRPDPAAANAFVTHIEQTID